MGIRNAAPGSLVTLAEGGSICVSDAAGDILDHAAGGAAGLFVAGRRLLSRLVLTVNGRRVAPVDHHVGDPASATFVGAVPSDGPGPGGAAGPVVVRRRSLGAGLR
ncbi:MAG TPA: glycogen debranching N-terminal domain-containing protein, partial [Acidimicrobiales bacterium]